jgi:5-methylcytosine-specific restriction endonuclease McrA
MPHKDPEIDRAYKAAWYQKHRERMRDMQRQQYHTKREERLRQSNAYREKHREELRQKAREYYAAHRSEILQRERTKRRNNVETYRSRKRKDYKASRERMSPEQKAAYNAQERVKRQSNPGRYAATSKRYYLKSPKERQESQKRSRQKRLEYYRRERVLAENRRRARKYQASINDFTQTQWIAMQEAYGHCCVYCGKEHKGYLTQDHIIPLSKGGDHTQSNIVPSCRSCNSKKGNRAPLKPVQPLLL